MKWSLSASPHVQTRMRAKSLPLLRIRRGKFCDTMRKKKENKVCVCVYACDQTVGKTGSDRLGERSRGRRGPDPTSCFVHLEVYKCIQLSGSHLL